MTKPIILEYDVLNSVESLMDGINKGIKHIDRFNEIEAGPIDNAAMAELETIRAELTICADRTAEAHVQLLKLTLRMTNVVSKIIQLKHQVSK